MTKELLLKLIQNKVDISHFIILQLISKYNELDEIWQDIKVRGYREALIRKGLIYEVNNQYFLSDKGIEILNLSIDEKLPEVNIENPIQELSKEILTICKSMIKEKTGKENFRVNKFSFLLSERDLSNRLVNFCRKFNTNDFYTIKKAIFAYLKDVLDNEVAYPRILQYFIYKEDEKKGLISDLLVYMETLNTKVEEKIDTRKLF